MEGAHAYQTRLSSYIPSSSSAKRSKTGSLQWPLSETHSVTPSSLAAAGFYYQPSPEAEDNVVCFLCHKALGGWEQGDQALSEHVAHSIKKPGQAKKGCPFALLKSGGIRCRDLGITDEKDLSKLRKDTFGKKADKWWPLESKKGYPKAADMVAGGFYFSAKQAGDDTVACCWCELELDKWDEGDDPAQEHRKRSPNCPFFGNTASQNAAPPSRAASASTRAPSADPDGWEELIQPSASTSKAAPAKKKTTRKKTTPSVSRSPSPQPIELDETPHPAPSLTRSTRASSRASANPPSAALLSQSMAKRSTRATRAESIEPTTTTSAIQKERILPACAPSMNLNSLLADTGLNDVPNPPHTVAGGPTNLRSSRSGKGKESSLAAKPKVKPTKKKIVEPAVVVEEEEVVEELADRDEAVERDEEMEELKSDVENLKEDVREPKEAMDHDTPEEQEAEDEEINSIEEAGPSASIPKTNGLPAQPMVQTATSPIQLDQQEDLSQIEEEEIEPTSRVDAFFHTATSSLRPEPLNPFETLDTAPEPIDPADLRLTLKEWHRKLIDQAVLDTERELKIKLEQYDEKVRLGRERLTGVLGL